MIDIFAAAGLKRPDLSILSDDFLTEVRQMPQRNLAVELAPRYALAQKRLGLACERQADWAQAADAYGFCIDADGQDDECTQSTDNEREPDHAPFIDRKHKLFRDAESVTLENLDRFGRFQVCEEASGFIAMG